METLYKVLDEDGCPVNGGSGCYSLPHDGQPGDWMPPVEGELVPCKNGYHLCTAEQLFEWFGPAIWEAEGRGDSVEYENKHVCREVRLLRRTQWNERTARLFACDCAEHVLHLYEMQYASDSRSHDCITVARQYANGETTSEELAAAWDAAWDAAYTAARDAARDTARAAAWDAARDAAGDAARAAAWDAARDAAGDAEREWQVGKLKTLLEEGG